MNNNKQLSQTKLKLIKTVKQKRGKTQHGTNQILNEKS